MIHVAVAERLRKFLVPALQKLHGALERKTMEFWDVFKIGRTHLMDATPVRLGQEFGLNVFATGPEPLPAIVVVTSYDYPQYVDAALRLGAVGYVLKTAPIDELLGTIRRAAAGKLSFDVRPSDVRRPLSARGNCGITRKEANIAAISQACGSCGRIASTTRPTPRKTTG